jgi:hypothetical protein
MYSTARQEAWELDMSCREVEVAISGTISEFAQNKENQKQSSAWVSDILIASLPKRTLERSVWNVKLQLDQLIAGGSGQAFLTSAHADANPGSFSPGERQPLVPFKEGDVSRPPGTIPTFRDEENILSLR